MGAPLSGGIVQLRCTVPLCATAVSTGASGRVGTKTVVPEYRSRFGVALPAFVIWSGVAFPMMAAATVACVANGSVSRYWATTPATWGDAMDVPLIVLMAVLLPIQAAVMPTPGANRSTHCPQLENVAFVSVLSEAATVNAAGALAGDTLHASLLSFPAATTNVTPDLLALSTASLSVTLFPLRRLMLATAGLTALAVTQSMPAITPEVVPEP